MIFPEHMEFRYYITPERKECYELYSMTLGCRRTLLEKTQDLGQCLVDLYDTDFYDTYCVLSEINKLLRPLTPEHKDETAWRKLLELAMPLCKVHPFFGLLIKELSDLEENHAYGKNDTKDILLRFDRDFENIVSDAKALIEVCLDDRYQPNYSTAERYREAHYDARLCFDDMRYGELATEEVMLERPAYDSAYNYSVEKLREHCDSNGIPAEFILVDSLEKAKALPCVFNNWAVFYDGKFVTVNQIDAAMLEKLIKR